MSEQDVTWLFKNSNLTDNITGDFIDDIFKHLYFKISLILFWMSLSLLGILGILIAEQILDSDP